MQQNGFNLVCKTYRHIASFVSIFVVWEEGGGGNLKKKNEKPLMNSSFGRLVPGTGLFVIYIVLWSFNEVNKQPSSEGLIKLIFNCIGFQFRPNLCLTPLIISPELLWDSHITPEVAKFREG